MIENIILAIVAIAAALIYTLPLAVGIYIERQDRKKRGEPDPSKAQFDERQELIRLKASQHALYVLGGYLLVWLIAEAAGVLRWENRTAGLLAGGLLLAFVVWNGECILRGAMLGFNQRKNEGAQIAQYLLLGGCWTMLGGVNWGDILGLAQMLMGVSWLVMGFLMLYARRRRKRLDTGDGAE